MTKNKKIETIGIYKPYNSSMLKGFVCWLPCVGILYKAVLNHEIVSTVLCGLSALKPAQSDNKPNTFSNITSFFEQKVQFIASTTLIAYAVHNIYESYTQKNTLIDSYTKKQLVETQDGQVQWKIIEPNIPIVSLFDLYNITLLLANVLTITNLLFTKIDHADANEQSKDFLDKMQKYAWYGVIGTKILHLLAAEDAETLYGGVTYMPFDIQNYQTIDPLLIETNDDNQKDENYEFSTALGDECASGVEYQSQLLLN